MNGQWNDQSSLNPHAPASAALLTFPLTMIHALPGMGADQRMYPPPWFTLPDFKAHNWVRYAGEKSLSQVAQVMSEVCGINDGDTVIGSSLGGMVACEIAKIRSLRSLYLIGSAVKKEEVNSLLRALRPLVRIAPWEWLKLSAESIPLDLARMFAASDASFVREMCSALFAWEGLGDPSTRVVRIHGKYDLVIPPPKTVDLLLEGGHLISITQAEACVAYLSADLTKA